MVIINDIVKNKMKEYRIGSPIQTDIGVTKIMDIDEKKKNLRVSGSPNNYRKDQVSPIEIDDSVFDAFSVEKDKWIESGKDHTVVLHTKDFACFIDGEYYGIVKELHEWKNIVESYTQNHLHDYNRIEEHEYDFMNNCCKNEYNQICFCRIVFRLCVIVFFLHSRRGHPVVAG